VDLQLAEGAYSRSFKGNQSPEDIEVALQLVHLLFTSGVQVVPEELQTLMKVGRGGAGGPTWAVLGPGAGGRDQLAAGAPP
jgi:hypothetical protein